MKTMMIIGLLSLFAASGFSQNIDIRRKIEVTGSAEAEVTPDILYLSISLKEYYKDNNSKKIIEIDELEKQLQQAVLSAGIPKENFTINNVTSYNYGYEKKKNPSYLAKKQYIIKITDLTKYNAIIGAVDPRAVEYTNIESYDYSKIESLKKELKIKALKASREKAVYLAEALNDKVTDALEIQEINNENYPQPMYRANVIMAKAEMDGAAEPIDFKKIKLNYQMRVVYQLSK
ncbi:MAG: SIMPL domain-containing protein [Chitinophagaceae bacterium]|nr:SIMPL domain-containing protein [Chitinophagaceae bacterium]